MTKWLKKYWLVLAILLVFLAARLPAVNQIYHQDEYKWAMQADPVSDWASPHPPMGKQTLRLTGNILGFENLRFAPLLFSFLCLALIYLTIKKITKKTKVALLGAFLFSINVYSVIASLQIDIDGAILPFFILLTYYAYLQLLTDSKLRSEGDKILSGAPRMWWVVFGIGIAGGFLTKLSFFIFTGTLIVDYLLTVYYSGQLNIKRVATKGLKFAVIFALLVTAYYHLNSSGTNRVIEYGRHFNSLNFASRAYFELAFKVLKSLVWLSPLFLLPVMEGLFNREILRRYRFWYIYLFFNFLFYLVLFDFAKLTVERYLMFLIIPCCIISAGVLGELMESFSWRKEFRKIFLTSLAFVLFSAVILSLPHSVLPLDPKINYVNHIKDLDFNFLIPLTGGSGPVGFYFSAQYILWSWIGAVMLLALGLLLKSGKPCSRFSDCDEVAKKTSENSLRGKQKFIPLEVRRPPQADRLPTMPQRQVGPLTGFILGFMIFGIGYNALFLNEYLFGGLFGSVPNVAKASVQYVLNNPEIKDATTYYDTGNYYLILANKSAGRFFTAPSRDYSPRFNAYKGYYMVVDFPAIDRNGRYWPFLERCKLDKQFNDKHVNSYIFNCTEI